MKPTLLITGANGFVGKALCSHAVHEGYQVVALTRKSFESTSHVESIVIDNFSEIRSTQSTLEKVEVVIHLAARVHVMNEYAGDGLAAYRKVNVENTLTVAKAAAASGVKRFIYLSSVKVNGEKTILGKLFTADDIPAPQDPYGISKLEAETALLSLGKQTDMEIVIIRPPLVYGPGVGANFAAMMRVVMLGIPMPLGSILSKRSMVALGNLTDLILLCATQPAAANQVFLVSDGDDISLPQLLRKMALALGVQSRIFPFPASLIWLGARMLGREKVAQRLCCSLQLDISKTKELLGWLPPISIDQGLLEVAKWYLGSKTVTTTKTI